MIEKRSKEWERLESTAMQLLENPRLLSKDAALMFYQPILRLWIYPSFSPYRVWVFYESDSRKKQTANFIVRQIIWDRNADFQRLNDPLEGLKKGFHTEPELEMRSIEIKKEIFNEILSELGQIQFSPFMAKRLIGLDGEGYGIETFGFSNFAIVSWWSVYPKELQELVEWFEKTTDYLQNEFSEPSES